MRVCLLGDILGRLDEGMKITTCHLYRELSKKNEVLLVRPKSLISPAKWKEVITFGPDIVHYIHGPSIRSFVLTKLLYLLSSASATVMSATRPDISKNGMALAALIRPDILLVQSSDQDADFTRKGFRCRFFPSGIDTQKFHPVSKETKNELRRKFNVPNDSFVILHVGHITPMRSLNILPEIATQKKYLVYIVAATSWVAPDKDLLPRLVNTGCFINTDFISEIEQVYQMSDCYIFPGFGETPSIEIPLSVLEAMACNLPVITGRFGGLPDLFAGTKGFYFADGADEVFKLLNDIANDSADVVKTREMVKKLSWRTLTGQLMEIYQDLISEK